MLRSGTRPLDAPRDGTGLSTPVVLAGILVVAFVLRLLFIGADGFKGDVSTFEAWSLTLSEHPMRDFFAKAGFADYPPGYFFILWFVGHAYKLLVHADPSYALLKIAVKLPAILMDLVDAALVFGIVRRFTTSAWALTAAALFAFNPATIFISAYWGQVDSVAGAMTLGSLLLLLVADGREGRGATVAIVGAWLLLAYSVLIKPPAVVLAPLYLAYVYASDDAAVRVRRALATAIGVALSFGLAYLAALAFHPGLAPVDQFAWLFGRYRYASGVYPYNTVNAFNLYAIAAGHFWQPDSGVSPGWIVGGHVVGLPQYAWGVVLFIVALGLVVSRYVQRRDGIALVEAAAILSLGFFVLSTRMHERYIFNAVMLAVPLAFYRRRYLYAVVALSVTLLANLWYSLDYLHVMTDHVPNVDASDIAPWLSRPASLLNVATFFYLGYAYLGTGEDVLERFRPSVFAARVASRTRAWFSPLEGVVAMRSLDWAIASGLTLASFALTFAWYVWPAEKIFDEIYYARAGEEYLQQKEIFEFTHPPLTKLLVTASMMLFGGMHGLGDTAAGWRFLNLVVGALMVLVLYCFAKRLFGSTAFATIAAGALVLDGFHFAQSRIATPEITVAFFTLTTLYAFYRFWIASQVRVAAELDVRVARIDGIALVVALALVAGVDAIATRGQSLAAHVVVFLYLGCGAYAAVRLVVPRVLRVRDRTSYADGSYLRSNVLATPDGGRVPLRCEAVAPGDATSIAASGDALVHESDGLRVTYGRDGAVIYATDAGEARFASDGTMRAGDATIDGARDARVWFAALCVSAGCLAASKWNGLFDFFVVWIVVGFVAAQRYWAPLGRAFGRANVRREPAMWGNPFGFSVDVVVTLMLFVGGSIYALAYVPYFALGHNVADLVSLQQQMYVYHHDTVAHATHPYSSKWWQWPILQIPISYYYHDFRTGAALQSGTACCVAEVMALPNPVTWWLGLVSVPFMTWLAWREKHKGYALLVLAYVVQWLPWILSPRISFEYHFFPNLAIILLADTLLLQRLWQLDPQVLARAWARRGGGAYAVDAPLHAAPSSLPAWNRIAVAGLVVASVAAFVFWYPVVAGTHVSYDTWNARMLTGLEGSNWINPHPGQ